MLNQNHVWLTEIPLIHTTLYTWSGQVCDTDVTPARIYVLFFLISLLANRWNNQNTLYQKATCWIFLTPSILRTWEPPSHSSSQDQFKWYLEIAETDVGCPKPRLIVSEDDLVTHHSAIWCTTFAPWRRFAYENGAVGRCAHHKSLSLRSYMKCWNKEKLMNKTRFTPSSS